MFRYNNTYMNPTPSFRTKTIPREIIREGFRSPVPIKEEPNIDLWINQFWKCLHTMTRTYEPNSEQSDKTVRESFSCFIQSLSGIIPSASMRALLQDFFVMGPQVQKVLLESKSLASFFTVHRDILTEIQSRPTSFFTWSLENGDKLFAWTFLLHSYFNLVVGLPIESYNVLRSQYHTSKISKESWANPIWYLLHSCSYYARPDQHCNMCFRAFISCLQYAIPCGKCRTHLQQNLTKFNIDEYQNRPDGLFELTVDLHNLVNRQLGKAEIGIDEAKRIYDPYGQPLVQQNMSVSRFIA